MALKITEKKAKEIVEKFAKDGDLPAFIEALSEYTYWYGKYSRIPRINFTAALITELLARRVDIYFAPDPIYVLSMGDVKMMLEVEFDSEELTDVEIEQVRKGVSSGLGCWHEVLQVAIGDVLEERKEESAKKEVDVKKLAEKVLS